MRECRFRVFECCKGTRSKTYDLDHRRSSIGEDGCGWETKVVDRRCRSWIGDATVALENKLLRLEKKAIDLRRR